jgi:hypothetical protein
MPTWKKVIVSGSDAALNALTVGTNQSIATNPSSTHLSGSFSGSFYGDGSGITGTTATSVANALTQGAGITAFSFTGAAARTVSISGSGALTGNTILKWDGTNKAFLNSNISDDGTQVTINAGSNSGLIVNGNSKFNNNLQVDGDLIVAGTASFVNTDNLTIKDRFILINSGSTSLLDSGWVTQYDSGGYGSAFYLEAANGTYGRFAVAYNVKGTSTSITADEYVITAKINQSSAPSTDPNWGGGGSGYYAAGNMHITQAGDIYIWS